MDYTKQPNTSLGELTKKTGKTDKLVLTVDRKVAFGFPYENETYLADPKDLCKCDQEKMAPCPDRKKDNTPDFRCADPEGKDDC